MTLNSWHTSAMNPFNFRCPFTGRGFGSNKDGGQSQAQGPGHPNQHHMEQQHVQQPPPPPPPQQTSTRSFFNCSRRKTAPPTDSDGGRLGVKQANVERKCGLSTWKQRFRSKCKEDINKRRACLIDALRSKSKEDVSALVRQEVSQSLNSFMKEGGNEVTMECVEESEYVEALRQIEMELMNDFLEEERKIIEFYEENQRFEAEMMNSMVGTAAVDEHNIGFEECYYSSDASFEPTANCTAACASLLIQRMPCPHRQALNDQLLQQQQQQPQLLQPGMGAGPGANSVSPTNSTRCTPAQNALEACCGAPQLSGALACDSVLCPVCRQNPLFQNRNVIFCRCGIRLDTKSDSLTLGEVKHTLEAAYARHAQGCQKEPAFAVGTFFDFSGMVMQCDACTTFDIIV
eukprot:GFYU01004350.1.p1 GENE.GFYU01004350.1~~GFYU01004350.1.p1  ORF type:complete len:403 (-),score=97.41 GFYU01004350.1:180-1388(-)